VEGQIQSQKPNKTKLLVIAALGIGLAAVGVFQFTASSGKPEKKAPAIVDRSKEAAADENQKTRTAIEQSLTAQLAKPKDPFKPIPLAKDQDTENSASTVVKAPTDAIQRPNVNYRGPALANPTMPPMAPNGAVTAGAPLRAPDEFAYKLVGVVSGPRPVAVFQDDAGHQKLVRQGEPVDEGSRVIAVSDGQVVVQHGKKNLTLSVGGRK